MRALFSLLIFTAALGTACVPSVTTLPTEESVEQVEHVTPPIYQLLYDAPALPETQASLQRVRMLIWLIQLDLNTTQLHALEQLRVSTLERQQTLQDAEHQAAQQQEAEERAIYDQLFATLQAGQSLDDPQLADTISALQELRTNGDDTQRLQRRLESMRATIEAMSVFLRSLSQTQENMVADALFFLRNRLDPIGNPGDFKSLIGSTYEPGQYAVLTRGTGEEVLKPMNIGGLWSDDAELTGRALHSAQREVILFFALQEPGMEEAIQTALALREQPTSP